MRNLFFIAWLAQGSVDAVVEFAVQDVDSHHR
jgi:hypothetical protein